MLRLITFSIVLLLIDIYAFQAIRLVSQNFESLYRNLINFVYWGISALAIGLLIAVNFSDYNTWNKYLFTLVRAILFIAYFSKIFIIAFLLIDDLRRIFSLAYEWTLGGKAYDPSRSKFISQLGLMVGSIPFFSLTYGIIRNPYRYKTFRKKVAIKNLPPGLEGLKIVQISDIHSGSFFLKEPIKNAIEMINKEMADLVFFTGDLVNSKAEEMEPFMDVFDKIESKHGVYSVLGNHDYGDYAQWPSSEAKKANLNRLKGIHKKLGWDLLLNENRLLDINNEKLAVIGVENISAKPQFRSYGDLKKAYAGAEVSETKILLSHDPSHWKGEVLKHFKDIDLTLSGHTHGFQFGIEIPGFISWSPSQYVYKQWAGIYESENQHLYVNRGLGFLGYPGRVGILPEITVLELIAKV